MSTPTQPPAPAPMNERVHFNLDTAEKENPVEPFASVIAGRRVVMTDPSDIPWEDLLDIESPVAFLKHCVSKEDREHIRSQKIEGWRFNALIEAYVKHYGIDLSRGNGRASRI